MIQKIADLAHMKFFCVVESAGQIKSLRRILQVAKVELCLLLCYQYKSVV